MEIYEIKRIIKKNKIVFNTLKILYKPVNYIKGLPEILKQYKILEERIKDIDENKRKVLYVGIPLHPNLGDQAQYYCINNWLEKNYKGYEIIEYPDCLINSNIFNINRKIKNIISKEDIIVFQSGYRTTDVANKPGEYAHRKIVNEYSNNKILVFPQTINFKDEIEFEKSQKAYSNGNKVMFLARDEKSYKMALEKYSDNNVELYPDIVTSLIGCYKFENERNGFLCCMRRDAEKFYENKEIADMIENLEKIDKVTRNDTTIEISADELRKNLKSVLENMIEEFSKYKVVITDRYHGTIFSLISNTPTIVIGSTDHKLSSGVDWFKNVKGFEKYIFFANSLEEAQNMAQRIYREKYDYTYQLSTYFNDMYYEKLKEKFEKI